MEHHGSSIGHIPAYATNVLEQNIVSGYTCIADMHSKQYYKMFSTKNIQLATVIGFIAHEYFSRQIKKEPLCNTSIKSPLLSGQLILILYSV